MFGRLRSHRRMLLIAVLGILILGAAGVYGVWRSREAQWATFSWTDPPFTFLYNNQLLASRDIPSEEEKTRAHTVFRATERETGSSPILFTARYEEGLRIVTSLVRQDQIDVLLGNSDKAFPLRYQGYTKLSERKFTVESRDAAELVFTYQGSTGETVKQRFLVVAYDADRAMYLAVQAKEADFADLNKRYFQRMFNSLAFPTGQ